MSEHRQSALKRLWTPSGALGNAPLMAFWRVRLVTALIGISILVLLPAAFLSAFFFHLRSLAAVGIVILAVGMASNAMLEAFRIKWVLHLGHWTGWKREPIWRNEQPVRYWTRTVMHATVLAVYATVAVLLVWLNLSWMMRR
jgi:hypothetical protein